VYCAVLPFNNIASGFIVQKWHVSNGMANLVMSATYLTAGFVSPLMGAVIDRIGLRYVHARGREGGGGGGGAGVGLGRQQLLL
jgi:hypothetical protein